MGLNEDTRTPRQIAKDMVLSAISGRMQSLITGDIAEDYGHLQNDQQAAIGDHIQKYLDRMYNLVSGPRKVKQQ